MPSIRWIACVFLTFFFAAAAKAGPPISEDDGQVSRGKEVYERNCLECHGDEGHGDGKTARERKFKARDFELSAFKCRCTPSGELPSDEDLFRTITNGIPGTPMRKFENTLSVEEREAVIAYVKTLTPRFAQESASECVPLPEEPVAATPELVREGAQVFRVMRCWTCHGVDGKGRGPAARGLRDDWGERIRVYDFTRGNRFKCGGSMIDLYRTLHTGMTGSPMPSFDEAFLFPRESADNPRVFDEVFDSQQVEEILEYVADEPDSAALSAMTAEEKEALRAHRTWALVHYLRSLSEEK